ncbi:MAG: HEAT repeat domain-containing protein [Planctomycetota bacterium]|nr:HEAT repeat domain-containing protein [Planctomycetota bacterium]
MKRIVLALGFGALLLGSASAGDEPADGANAYLTRARQLKADDVAGHYRLALWCDKAGLKTEARREFRAVVTLDTDHRAARRALGYENVRGRWVKGKEAMRAKGFVEYKGSWVTAAEYALYAKDKIAAQKARDARITGDAAIKKLYNQDPLVRARAMGTIERIEALYRLRPLSIAARVKHPDIRKRAIAGLGALNTKDALPPLYKRAIFDPVEDLRNAAVDAIRANDAKGKTGPFLRAAGSPFDKVRVAAVKALGNLGDASAVGPLVARYQVVGGSGQSVYISQVNQISFVQDFDVEVAQTQFIADPVIGVIQDGLVLNFRALATSGFIDIYEKPAYAQSLHKLTGKDIGNDAKAWMKWYRNEQLEKKRAAAARSDSDS